MYLIFVLESFLFAVFSAKFFKKRLNPVTLYLFIWNIMIGLYELRWVKYNEITDFAWITVILFAFIYSLACIMGSRVAIVYKRDSAQIEVTDKELKKLIVGLSAVAACAVIPNFVNFIRKYSFAFMDQMNNIYQDRLMGTRGFEMIPYLGTLSATAVVIAGIYFRRYGFNKMLLLPLGLELLDALPGGGRAGIIIEVFLFITPSLLFPRKETLGEKMTKKTKVAIFLVLVLLVYIFWQMSSVRSRWIKVNEYMSPTMVALYKFSPAIYKTYTYIVGPFVALSEYLKEQTFSFGINTFGMFYNILNKIGFHLPYQRYQDVYYTPLPCNVASYIRELIQDFTYVGAMVVTFFIGFLFGTNFNAVRFSNNMRAESVCSVLGTIIALSFFMFFMRETVFWIMTIVLPICFSKWVIKILKTIK